MRGELTQKIKNESIKLIGYEIKKDELKLIPYLHHCLINFCFLDNNKINYNEHKILCEWDRKNFINFIPAESKVILMDKDFWNFMNKMLYMSYVNQK